MSDARFRHSPGAEPRRRQVRPSPLLERERARSTSSCLRKPSTAAAYPGAASTLVASGSAEVLARARQTGMAAVADPPGGGLNEAVAAATAAARARGARGVFVLPVDLPLLTAAGLRDLLAQASPAPVCLLVPDRRGAGTNLIYQSPIRVASYAFGDGSFERHRLAARAAGLRSSCGAGQLRPRSRPSADYTVWRVIRRHRKRQGIASTTRRTLMAFDVTDFLAEGGRHCLALAKRPLPDLLAEAEEIRQRGHGRIVSYSRKVFAPLTHLCRDSCAYCTFAKPPRAFRAPYMSLEEVLAVAESGAKAGCKELLFTLGDKPELRYAEAADWLKAAGHRDTFGYLHAAAAESSALACCRISTPGL